MYELHAAEMQAVWGIGLIGSKHIHHKSARPEMSNYFESF